VEIEDRITASIGQHRGADRLGHILTIAGSFIHDVGATVLATRNTQLTRELDGLGAALDRLARHAYDLGRAHQATGEPWPDDVVVAVHEHLAAAAAADVDEHQGDEPEPGKRLGDYAADVVHVCAGCAHDRHGGTDCPDCPQGYCEPTAVYVEQLADESRPYDAAAAVGDELGELAEPVDPVSSNPTIQVENGAADHVRNWAGRAFGRS
jgi:hypothetical protein